MLLFYPKQGYLYVPHTMVSPSCSIIFRWEFPLSKYRRTGTLSYTGMGTDLAGPFLASLFQKQNSIIAAKSK